MSTAATALGLLLPSRDVTLWADGDPTLLVEAAVTAEAAGFDSVWVGDSLLARPRPEPLSVLAAVAARTRSVRLGTAVLLPLLRQPIISAHILATIDRLAPGRVVVGVAPGSDVPGTHAELAAVGVRSDRRVADLMAIVDRWRRIWSGPGDGSDTSPRPATPTGPPLWLGAHGPRMLRLAGSCFEGWLPFSPSPSAYREGLAEVRAAAEGAGRGPDEVTPAAYLTVAVNRSGSIAQEELDVYMRAYHGLPASVMGGIQACHAGTLESAADWMSQYVSAGARELIVRVAAPRLRGWEETARSLLHVVRGR